MGFQLWRLRPLLALLLLGGLSVQLVVTGDGDVANQSDNNDLIFDEESEGLHGLRRTSRLSRWSKPDQDEVVPVSSPEAAVLHNISSAHFRSHNAEPKSVERPKRQWWNPFGGDESAASDKNTTTTTTTSAPVQQHEDSEEEKQTTPSQSRTTRQVDGRKSDTPIDDEDEGGSSFHEGSGTDGPHFTEEPRPGPRPVFFRCKLAINVPFSAALTQRSSPEFHESSMQLTHALENLYQGLPGQQTVTVLRFERASRDPFFSIMTFDLGSQGFDSEEALRSVLRDQVTHGALQGIPLSSEEFEFRPLEGREEPGQNGGGQPDIPVPKPPPAVDRCRADTTLTCPDGTTIICEVQWCDGTPDCPKGEDEQNCPDEDVCRQGEFECDQGRCIPDYRRCDGAMDCLDGSDENGCRTAAPECRSDEFRCTDGTCIPDNLRCNEYDDCRDGSDEFKCPCNERTQFQCDNGFCINLRRRCDGTSDCQDGSDERNCPRCSNVEHQCYDGTCIDVRRVCDGRPDCVDGSDERDCHPTCRGDEFTCRDGQCVPSYTHCNGYPECRDGSDEHNCPPRCAPHQYQCDGDRCIEPEQRCDRTPDCRDGSDELGCAPPLCTADQFRCDDSTCIESYQRCDHRPDCRDGSDERACPSPTCAPGQFDCGDGSCIESHQRCDRRYDCRDGSDERDCQPECTEDQFTCGDGSCIESYQRCDRRQDCRDGSDERECQPECTEDQFSCGDGSCIESYQRCDRRQDCRDGSDERECQPECTEDQFNCGDGSCIESYQRCDRRQDCRDGSDERDCQPECTASQFSCGDGSCVELYQRCDHRVDCRDGSDEHDCQPPACTPDQFRCGDGSCIESYQKCDRRPDCRDGSDERDCPPPDCTAGQFRCGDGSCIESHQRCDRRVDCRDGSDEQDCRPAECSATQFQCSDGSCIEQFQRCDQRQDCRDGSDERGCPPTCSSADFTCRSGDCVPYSDRCNGRSDCRDGSDEIDCQFTPVPACTSGEFRCDDGRCIPQSQRCDRRYDCRDYSDERDCDCRGSEFRCNNGDCIPLEQRCDRTPNCPDGSDELTCPPVDCLPGEFSCGSTRQCIPSSQVCDGKYDCSDYSDERNCQAELNLKTYPSEQTTKEGYEVVFQCRDEGLIRAPVRWTRSGGLPLPPGSRDVNGRLEMPDIKLEHTGSYVCEAVGYSPTTPGSQVTVFLQVERFVIPPAPPIPACAPHEATCMNGECVRKELLCDNKPDCSDGSDEFRCRDTCEPNEFQCDNRRCVPKTWRCDSDNDCGDNSDERNCGTPVPGSPCRFNEFQCANGNQCIPKSFHCDREIDCQDRSDELRCTAPTIHTPPAPMIMVNIAETFTITCRAVGVPTPEIVWRLNWGHIPPKCTTTSVDGYGTLVCADAQLSDQGAYSCEAVNNLGSTFAIPDSIVTVKRPEGVCRAGTFNDAAATQRECLSCFCFGVATDCHSADMHTSQLPAPPAEQYRVFGVSDGSRSVTATPLPSSYLQARGAGGAQLYLQDTRQLGSAPNSQVFFGLPQSHLGNQLASYGGYLRYTVRFQGSARPVRGADIILMGNGMTLFHIPRSTVFPNRDNDVEAQFRHGEWYKSIGGRAGGDIPVVGEEVASRPEIMMALESLDNILIRAQYLEGPTVDTSLTNLRMDTGVLPDTGQGPTVFVEKCRCPEGYTGFSCEDCARGFNRIPSSNWLGRCEKDLPPTCPSGHYEDGGQCRPCPCPDTDAPRQFGTTCYKDTDGRVTCNCRAGYRGRQCGECDSGYTQNPQWPYDCIPQGSCDVSGSLSPSPDPLTGQCQCKDYTVGPTCNQCQLNTFYLNSKNQYGCLPCFCMGITNQCSSSSMYRQQEYAVFTTGQPDFSLVDQFQSDTISDGLSINQGARELLFRDFSRIRSEVYYWRLPVRFLGDKVTSYGGYMNYTVRYVPTPGGQSSRNNAPDVEISGNDIQLLYFSREQIPPNRAHTVEVPFFEQHWQRQDGQPADRAHFLMALADLDSILIKATYTTNTQEAGISQVYLDTASERNTGQSRAYAVEQCACPSGYRGLSCEDCDAGHTRSTEGLYLGLCKSCFCNGHSSECDPESGTCRNCRDHTTGTYCDQCEEGYEGDATRGSAGDCRLVGPPPQCRCDPRGSVHLDCPDGRQCVCKANAEGPNCNVCRRGTFGLAQANPLGCGQCSCSGVTDQCSASNLYRTQIPMQIIDGAHGFSLTDSNRYKRVTEGITVDVAENELGYSFPRTTGPSDKLFWSLPPLFTGNKVASYGGQLSVTQRFTAQSDGENYFDTDVVLIGNGMMLYWVNEEEVTPGHSLTYTVPLHEARWTHLGASGPHPVSRQDMLTALSNLQAVLIRATYNDRMETTFLRNVVMDTAIQQYTGQQIAAEVEECQCPPGYRGTSCEQCVPRYYRDPSDRSSGPLGSCKPCPCNNREESCAVDRDNVVCHCQPGYTGAKCEVPVGPEPPPTSQPPPTIVVTISEPSIQVVEVGQTARFHCTGRSLIGQQNLLRIRWSKEHGDLPPARSHDDGQGLLVITEVRVSDSGSYACTITDGFSIQTQTAQLNVAGGGPPSSPRVTITPRYLQASVGEPAELACTAEGNPPPTIQWTGGQNNRLGPEVTVANGVLYIPALRKSDEAEYFCTATNAEGEMSERTIIYVQGEDSRPQPTHPPTPSQVIISPADTEAQPGETIRLSCQSPRGSQVQWSRAGAPLPSNAIPSDTTLTIYSAGPTDTGVYICTATTQVGGTEQAQARVTIVSFGNPPSARVEPDRQTVGQGSTAELRCITSGDPTPVVTWSKVRDDLTENVQSDGDILRIINTSMRDRGVYVCKATNPSGSSEASAILEVERREPPSLEIYPNARQSVTEGSSALFQCRVTGGIPSPIVRWARLDGAPMPPSAEILDGGVVRFSRVTSQAAGHYQCVAENDAGTVSANAVLEIQGSPVISISPHSPHRVHAGQQVRMECRAQGDPAPTVSWRRLQARVYDGRELPPRETPQSAIYEITRATKEDEGVYSCTARSPVGVTEERFELIVDDRGVAPVPPYQDVFSVPVGGRAEMRCYAYNEIGGQADVYLNWVRTDNGRMPADHIIQEGVLYINNVQPDAAGEYSCLGVGPGGNVVFTAIARLVVIAPPRIQLNPVRQVVRPGDLVHITCSATGDQPINIEWKKPNGQLPSTVVVEGGRMMFRGIRITDAGRYICLAQNSAGAAEAVAEVIVSETPVVSPTQRTHIALTGSTVDLECALPEATYTEIKWDKDGGDLPLTSFVENNILSIVNVDFSDAGRYGCEARTHSGVSSEYIILKVQSVADVTLHVEASHDSVRLGDTVDITCTATSQRHTDLQWSKVGGQLGHNIHVSGGTMRVSDVNADNGGVYRCQAVTDTGLYEADYVLAIQAHHANTEIPALDQPVETRTAPFGSTVVMDCRTDLEPPVTFTWAKQGGILPRMAQVQGPSLSIPDVRASEAGTYVCTARNNKLSMDIPTVLVVTGVVPYFAQAPVSYVSLPTLPDAYLQFDVEISFKPESSDGLILYNGQRQDRDRAGDFVSFGLNDGYAEFRFDVGSGPAVLRSEKPLEVGKWHTAKLKRNKKDGVLVVDDQAPVSDVAKGVYQGLDLVESMYIGGVPDPTRIHQLAGHTRGFVGCVSRLVLGTVEMDLVRDAVSSQGVTTCETCALNPCVNSGVCQEAHTDQGYACICPAGFSGRDCEKVGEACYPGACGSGRCINVHGGFECYCPFGKTGDRCEKDIVIYEPAFSDDAYVAYPTPKGLRRLRMAMKFKPHEVKDSVLMYCAQSEDGHGDFTSLAIRDRHLEFRFDTGSGPAVLRSQEEVKPGEWVKVVADRDMQSGLMTINEAFEVSGTSPGTTRGLNLRTPLYVGGVDRQRIRMAPGVDVSGGFSGCVSEVEVSGVELDLVASVVDAANVQDCGSVSPCQRRPCKNQGQCQEVGVAINDYECHCPSGFGGKNCEVEDSICHRSQPCKNGGSCVGTAHSHKCMCPLGFSGENCQEQVKFVEDVKFQSDGYVELSRDLLPHAASSETEVIALELATIESDGIILWHGQTPDTDGKALDYLALAVVDGYLEFSYELGSGPAQIRTPVRVDDGKVHKVVLRRTAKEGSIELDGGHRQLGESPGILLMLNAQGNIYIGGLPDSKLMTAGRYDKGFSGCIRNVQIQSTGTIDLFASAISAQNVRACSSNTQQQSADDEDYEDGFEEDYEDNFVEGLNRATRDA